MSEPFASESGHYYFRDGRPCYTVIGANGKERATTLRDARKLNLVAGYTTIANCAAKPGLEYWKANQLLMAALTLPRRDGEPESEWVARVWDDSKEQARGAAERGTEIHAAIERSFRGETQDPLLLPFVMAARNAIAERFPDEQWSTERSFASPLGYGGKVDLHSPRVVLDVKTKDGDLSDVKCYDEHFMQAAAYARGLDIPSATCGIVFVNRKLPARAVLIEHSLADTERGWRMFVALLRFWQAKNRIDE